MCCGSQTPAAATPQPNRVRAQAVPEGSRVLIKYVGNRKAGFPMRGQKSGISYMVPGQGEYVVTHPDGLMGIDPSDASWFIKMDGGKAFIQV